MKVTTALRSEQAAYYRLCDEARALGIPTSLDDPRSPQTVAELQAAVDAAMKRFTLSEGGEPFAEYDAPTARDALAKFAIDEGFADPREFIDTPEDFFYDMPDGSVGMVFTNTEITAKEQ